MPEEIVVDKLITELVQKPDLAWWLTYLESFRLRLKPELSRFTLKTIGDWGHLSEGDFSSHTLSKDKPRFIGDSKFSIGTQGIFSAEILWPEHPKLPAKKEEGVKMFWGLTRNGEWIIVEYYYQDMRKKREEVWKAQVATRVNVREIELKDLFQTKCRFSGIDPRKVWELLSYQVEQWHKKREELFRQSKLLFDETCLVSKLCSF